MSNRIHVKGDYIQEEAVAGAAGIKPGMLVMLNSDDEIVVHSVEGGYAEAAITVEDALQGGISTDAYTADEIASYILPVKGAVVNMIIEAGQNIAIGEKLVSAGNGKLISYDDSTSGTTVQQVIAVAVEENDLSASGAVDTLSAVRII